MLIWSGVLLIYYSVELSAFFGENNDWKSKAHDLYIGMLVIAVEATIIGSIFTCIGGVGGLGCVGGASGALWR